MIKLILLIGLISKESNQSNFSNSHRGGWYEVVNYLYIGVFTRVTLITPFTNISVIYSVQAYKVRIKSVRRSVDLQLATPGSNNSI